MTSDVKHPDLDLALLRRRIGFEREELGRTIEELIARMDVKARTRRRVHDLWQRIVAAFRQFLARLRRGWR